MKNLSFVLLFFFLNLSAFAQHGVVKSAGAMSEMGKPGFAPTISMDSLQQYPHIFGMGPLQEKYEHQDESGELIGVYSQIGKGIYTHQSSNIHVHFINGEKSFTGHVDKIQTHLKGAGLYLPKPKKNISFKTNDTDFSKGRLGFHQEVELDDLVKFHGHLCDGLVVGAMGLNQALEALFPEGLIDRTDLRIVSKSSPCLTDVAVYLTGARYQFGTFYVDNAIDGMYIVQKISDGKSFKSPRFKISNGSLY